MLGEARPAPGLTLPNRAGRVSKVLTRIHIENYRCFRDFELEPGPFTVILGANGTGKSSFFDVLHCVYRLQSGWSGVEELFPAWSRYRGDPEGPQRVTVEAILGTTKFRYELVVDHDRRGRARARAGRR